MLAAILEAGEPIRLSDQEFDAAHWEWSRNDQRLGAPGSVQPERLKFIEVRHREYLRTSNGRPREFTTTNTRTIERGWGR